MFFYEIADLWNQNPSTSATSVVKNISRIEHHSFVPEHFLKIDCEVGLSAAKNCAARASCVTFRQEPMTRGMQLPC